MKRRSKESRMVQVKLPTRREDAAIRKGIRGDPDNPEWTPADFRRAMPLVDAVIACGGLRKIPVLLRVDPDVLARFRASGPGWQTRMNAALRKAAGLPKDSPRARARKRGRVAG
jgi:uncharacterized protein (DUF4415 family)